MTKDEPDLEKIYKDNYLYIYNLCRKRMSDVDNSIVEDVVHDAFLSAFKNIHKYRSSIASIKTWIASIAINKYRDYFRLKKKQRHVSIEGLSENVTKREFLEKMLKKSWDIAEQIRDEADERDEIAAIIIQMANKKLNPRTLEVFKLRYVKNMRYKEISKKLGISTTNARRISSNAIASIRSLI